MSRAPMYNTIAPSDEKMRVCGRRTRRPATSFSPPLTVVMHMRVDVAWSLNRAADRGRAAENRAWVDVPDRRAALPRDTLLKQGATLKSSAIITKRRAGDFYIHRLRACASWSLFFFLFQRGA